MLDRIINWVKSLFHEETPEEQDKRIHETIKSWKENVDKETLAYVDTYYEMCKMQALLDGAEAMTRTEVSPNHLELWNSSFPRIKNGDNALNALNKWHTAHLFLARIYCFDVTDPPDGSQGRFNKHVDIRPAKWLKDLADEEKRIKALEMEKAAKEWKVRAEDIKECEDEYKKSLKMK